MRLCNLIADWVAAPATTTCEFASRIAVTVATTRHTKSGKGATVKTKYSLFACVIASLVIVAGCYESLRSVVTPDKLVFYEDLLGEYELASPGTGRVRIG